MLFSNLYLQGLLNSKDIKKIKKNTNGTLRHPLVWIHRPNIFK